MNNYTIIRRQKGSSQFNQLTVQVAITLVSGLVLFFVAWLAIIILFGLINLGKIYPGVSMAGVALGGMTPQEATDKLARTLHFPQNGKIVFESGDRVWIASPAELGLSLDFTANAQKAYDYGRSENLIRRWTNQAKAWGEGTDIAVSLRYDEQKALDYLDKIAAEVNQPVEEASLKLEGVDVVAVPGQIGKTLDVAVTLRKLQEQIKTLADGVIALEITETPPEIMDASQQAETARQILSKAFTLTLPDAKGSDPGPWIIPPDQLAEMLAVEKVDDGGSKHIQVNFREEELYTYLTAISTDINRNPENARFIFNDDTRRLEVIKPAVTGRSLDVYSSIKGIRENLQAGQHSANLSLVTNHPEIGDDVTAEQLGITENLITYTSYFRGSTSDRMQNIKIAAANFHGLLIAPGETFSMASAMGNVSLDTGYAEAWIIFGGRTIKGVGGGVCQVSTTLFRAAFLAGFPINERHPHAYRVSYYEQTAGGVNSAYAGLDATVFVPMVDLKFTNDSPYWLLMETYYYPNSHSLTWKFYSTSDGRKVEWETSGLENIVDPPDPEFEENPELSKGEIRQVDWAVEGADVTVTRTVYRNGQVMFSDSFVTHYMPWADVYQYGPGTNLKQILKKKTTPPIFTR